MDEQSFMYPAKKKRATASPLSVRSALADVRQGLPVEIAHVFVVQCVKYVTAIPAVPHPARLPHVTQLV